jgi:hypothetical protein
MLPMLAMLLEVVDLELIAPSGEALPALENHQDVPARSPGDAVRSPSPALA